MTAQVLLLLVGIVFLLTGFVKVVHSRPFIEHVRNLGFLPRSLTEFSASLFIQLECGVGTALVLFAFPLELIPVLAVAVPLLSMLTVWGVTSGRVADCGCYGGWLNLDLKLSLGLNLLYLTMLSAAWLTLDRDPEVAMWKVLTIIAVMALSNFLVRHSANTPLLSLSPLKPGRRWKAGWVEALDPSPADGRDSFIVFMSQACYRCRNWHAYLGNMINNPELPDPVLVFPEGHDIESLDDNMKHCFIKPRIFRFLVQQTPTAVLVRNGRITGKWTGRFPEEFV